MLIRSQDRTKLVDIAGKTISIKRINSHINNIEITYANSSVVLGTYNEENALKVLDVIEKTYCKRDSEYITLRMPKRRKCKQNTYVIKYRRISQMKNREKFAKEILDIACKGEKFSAIKSGEITFCDRFKCDMCKFNDSTGEKSCRIKRYEWSESEYVETTITSREKAFLDILLPSCKYIARDKDNLLYVCYDKPIRCNKFWISDYVLYDIPKDMYGDMFDFIKWEDEEPWSIKDLKKLEVKDE